MDKEESLALFVQGRDAWNVWAAKMLTEREVMETEAWRAESTADFSEHEFEQNADFERFVFPGRASFDGATFSEIANFHKATFYGTASFNRVRFFGPTSFERAAFSGMAHFEAVTFSSLTSFSGVTFSRQASFVGAAFSSDVTAFEATFSDIARFEEATFSGMANFEAVTFSSQARFHGATFSDNAQFSEATFSGATRFDRGWFEKTANFRAIDSESLFSLDGATFLTVPDFIQAHFAEAPRLDDSRIKPHVKNRFKGDRELSARWRALKRLAVQGHDHMREIEFFKYELKTRRLVTDRPWHAVYWFGLFYGWLSAFGRSIWLPLIWWVMSAFVFAQLYLNAHFDLIDPEERPSSFVGWTIDRIILQPLGAAKAPPLSCKAGVGDPWWAALELSSRKALLIFGLDVSDKSKLNYACLYGVVTQKTVRPGQQSERFYLDVPNSVIVFGITQHVISAVLLFLLLIAIRNNFRIK